LFAAENGNYEAVRDLVSAGANVNFADDLGWTPILFAAKNGNYEAVRDLVSAGANVNVANNRGQTPILFAAENGNYEAVRDLVSAGANVNFANDRGWTPILFAAQDGNCEAIRDLVSAGANVNFANDRGWTPILFAAKNGNCEAIRDLVSAGGDFNVADDLGQTPILSAAQNGNYEAVKFLASEGANSEPLLQRDHINNSDCQLALEQGNSLFEIKKENEKLIRQNISEIMTGNIFDKGNQDVNKIVGSFLEQKDTSSISQLQKPSSTLYQDTTNELRKYKSEILEQIESGQLEVTGHFKHQFLGGMDTRLNPVNYKKLKENRQIGSKEDGSNSCCVIS